MNRLLHCFASSIIMAILFFAVIRLSYDVTIGEDYWSIHSSLFIVAEILMTWCYSLIAVILTPVFIGYASRHRISPAVEYLIVIAFATACVLAVISVSHSIDTEDVNSRLFITPLTVTALLSCLYYSYCTATERKRRLAKQTLDLEKTRNIQLDTELRLLRAQYHPHFLFNMLNTIYVQIDEANEAPRHTIECLSEVLRYQLYSPETPIDVESELEAMEKYIELCRLRASSSLKLNVSIGQIPHGMKIYPLLLIPLIENAFKHVGGDFGIDISFEITGEDMRLRVSNTVPAVATVSHTGTTGLGLENLRRRIRLLYPGNKHKLTIDRDSERFTATLNLKTLSDSPIKT